MNGDGDKTVHVFHVILTPKRPRFSVPTIAGLCQNYKFGLVLVLAFLQRLEVSLISDYRE